MRCRVCGSTGEHQMYSVREMMFGIREEFDYFQCIECACLQISEFPHDMSRYYGEGYYSFSGDPGKTNPLLRFLRSRRNRYIMDGRGLIGKLLNSVQSNDALCGVARVKPSRSLRILDVGSGSGNLVYALKDLGFRSVLGIDPYLESDRIYPNGAVVKKQSLEQVDGNWDLIMFHHVFEHMSDPFTVLQEVRRLISDNGRCLLRIPTVTSEAWDIYRTNWVQLDAPRHFFLHSHQSIRHLASSTGFTIESLTCDSTAFQFWGSEQYANDIPLMSKLSYLTSRSASRFSKSTIREYEMQAERLNKEQRGDQIAVLLKRNST